MGEGDNSLKKKNHGDGSVSKVFTLKVWSPEFSPQNPHKKMPTWRLAPVVPAQRQGDSRSSLASQFCLLGASLIGERPHFQNKHKQNGRWSLRSNIKVAL